MSEELPPEIERVVSESDLGEVQRILRVFKERVSRRHLDEDPKGIALAIIRKSAS